MGVTLDQLVYDAADGGAEVGSHTLAGDDGTAIGHVSDALKVNFSNTTIAVTATQLDIDDLNATDDAVASHLHDGTGTAITSTGGAIDVNIASGADFDIRDLSHTQDSVKIGDGVEFLAINTDGSINTKAAAPSNPKTSTASVVGTAVELAATALTERTRILIQNHGNKPLYYGEDNTVTSSTGILIPRGASMELPYGASADAWVISEAGASSNNVRVLELD